MPPRRTAKAHYSGRVRSQARDGFGERRTGFGHLDVEVAGLVAEQVLEVLVAGRFPHHYAFTSGWLGDRMITRSDPDPRHYAAAEQAPGTTVRLTVPGERTPVP